MQNDYFVCENEVVYVHHMEDRKPVNRMIGLTAIESADAEGITNSIKSTFENYQMPDWE